MAQEEVPGPEDRNGTDARKGGHGLTVLVHPAFPVAEIDEKEKAGPRAQGGDFLFELLQGQVVEDPELQIRGDDGQQVVQDGLARCRAVRNHDKFAHVRLQGTHELQGGLHVHILPDASHPGGQGRQGTEVHTAEDRGHTLENALAVTEHQVEGAVVEGHDEVGTKKGVFAVQAVGDASDVLRIDVELGVQVFDPDDRLRIKAVQCCFQGMQHVVGPSVARMIGVEDEHLPGSRGGLRPQGRGEKRQGGQEKREKKSSRALRKPFFSQGSFPPEVRCPPG